MCNKTVIRPTLGSYILLLLIFSIPLLIVPIFMGWQLYVNSGFCYFHIPLSLVCIFWCFYLYRVLEIGEGYFKLYYFKFLKFDHEVLGFDKINGWSDGNPIRLFYDGGEFQIRWGMYSVKDCQKIKSRLNGFPAKKS